MSTCTMKSLRAACGALSLALLAACGGGGGDPGDPLQPGNCSVAARKQWLLDYFQGNAFGAEPWYFWYALSPLPDPAAYADEAGYFDALLYTGTDPAFPRDRWSYSENTTDFNLHFGEGKSLGYGMFVTGIEAQASVGQPLMVRYVEPQSPAATAGVGRGDRVVSINGRLAADLIAANDYSVLSPASESESVNLVLADAQGHERALTVRAAVFPLTPVPSARVSTTPQGRKMGYLLVKDMISQVSTPLASALAQFRANAVSELVVDLRYNGGGLVSVAREIASYAAGTADNGKVFTSLLYNDRQAANNRSYVFEPKTESLALQRVFVLTGPRTASASEQLVNGLRGIGIEVVLIGDTTYGKPVGFLPASNGCGTTYSVVNFESVNALNQGRYFDGFSACPVAEDWQQPLGEVTEPLLAAARLVADGSACAATSASARERASALRATDGRQRPVFDGERPSMIPR